MAAPVTAGLIVLKQPRTGSTWLKAELNALPGVFLRFEPLSDTRFNTSECAPSFTNLVLARLLREARAMRCVSRKLKDDPCYWAKQRCNPTALLNDTWLDPSEPPLAVSGFLVHPHYVGLACSWSSWARTSQRLGRRSKRRRWRSRPMW